MYVLSYLDLDLHIARTVLAIFAMVVLVVVSVVVSVAGARNAPVGLNCPL